MCSVPQQYAKFFINAAFDTGTAMLEFDNIISLMLIVSSNAKFNLEQKTKLQLQVSGNPNLPNSSG